VQSQNARILFGSINLSPGKGPGYSFGRLGRCRLHRSGITERAVVDGEAPVFGLSEDIGKTAIPQYLVDKIRSAGWTVRERTCPPGCERYPIGQTAQADPFRQLSRRAGNGSSCPTPAIPPPDPRVSIGWISAVSRFAWPVMPIH
jgi:hypothetical protein